jgi:phospholipid/cholesterol/gamma-HCH transport system substrate-binding protein/paraquat-inducible protein B
MFVFTGLVLAILFVVILAGTNLFARHATFETYFSESVQGLEVGSPVKLRGVLLGKVTEIGLVDEYYSLEDGFDRLNFGQLVIVRFQILDVSELAGRPVEPLDLEAAIENGLRLRLAQAGLTGTAYIEADFLDAEMRAEELTYPWTPETRYIPSSKSTISTISSAAERIAARLETIDVAKLFEDVDRLVVRVTETVDSIDTAVSGADLGRVSKDLSETLNQLTKTVTHVQLSVESGRYDFETTLENLRVASENLREFSETARSYPSILLRGNPPEKIEVRPQ